MWLLYVASSCSAHDSPRSFATERAGKFEDNRRAAMSWS